MQLHDIPPIITLSPLTSHYLAAKLLLDEGIVFDFCGTLDKDFRVWLVNDDCTSFPLL